MGYKEQKQDKQEYELWAFGWNDKGKQTYHPYTRKDFKFDSQVKK